MYVVIFKAKLKQLDPKYEQTAQELRQSAFEDYGCLAFDSVTENGTEISLSYWPDEAAIRAWKNHADHLIAQQLGRERWYDSYTIQVARIDREYRFDGQFIAADKPLR